MPNYSMTKEERRLLHHKAQQPTYGVGAPDASTGQEGDISYRKVGRFTIQYLKQDGKWVEVSSSDNAGNISSEEIGGDYISNDTDFLNKLRKYRSTIASWSKDWCIHHNFAANFAETVEGSISANPNYLQYSSGYVESNTNVRVLVPDYQTLFKSVSCYFTTSQNTDAFTHGTTMRLTLAQSKDSTNNAQGDNEVVREVQSGFTIQPGDSHGYAKFFINETLIPSKSYVVFLEQTSFDHGYVLKYGQATSHFAII